MHLAQVSAIPERPRARSGFSAAKYKLTASR